MNEISSTNMNDFTTQRKETSLRKESWSVIAQVF